MTSFPRLDLLPLAQRQIWPELAAARTEGFVLGHGLDLAHGCGGAQALFSTFAPQECLKALSYFKDPALGGRGERVKRTLVDAAARVMSIPKLVITSKTLSVRR